MTTFGGDLCEAIERGGRAEQLVRLGASAKGHAGPPVLDASLADFLAGVAETAPYLGRLMRREDLGRLLKRQSGDVLRGVLPDEITTAAVPDTLRRAKRLVHLALALADLAGLWSVDEVTTALSDFADRCVDTALRAAWDEVAAQPRLDLVLPDSGAVPGLSMIAMGKLGACELNYSSDIDLIAVYDGDRLPPDGTGRLAPKPLAVRVVQRAVAILSDHDAEGYVFRTDLRLRPDPGSTAVAVSLGQAERYYEQYGQNWERAAHIKARCCAGDRTVGAAYLDLIRPFVWRRTLDYWALGDVRAIKNQIHAQAGNPDITVPGGDVKLGPGGIREIEFFAQTQQLILGGRDPALRVPDTLGALEALRAAGHLEPETARQMAADYRTLREVEHRIQMRQDEPTQTVPLSDAARQEVAAMMGIESLAGFDSTILSTLHRVHDAYAALFDLQDDEAAVPGSLVFTGVDDDPRTLTTLSSMGFGVPSEVIATVRRWHQGGLAATRSTRARELLTILVPRLLNAAADTDDPDFAWAQIDLFLRRLPSGLQVFSLFTMHPEALDDVVTLCVASPVLARQLASRPSLVEGLLEDRPPAPSLHAEETLEGAMDATRRVVAEARLRQAAVLTLGRANPDEVGTALAGLADRSVRLLSDRVRAQILDRGLPAPPLCVLGFGRLGAEALTVASDLDLVFVYDGGPEVADAVLRRVRRLVTALSAPTAEGILYEIDMKLRPSGGAGPAAVSLGAFSRYYEETARIWEAMALTKARVVAAEGGLGARVEAVIEDRLLRPRDEREVGQAVREMRQRLLDGHPPRGPLDVKRMHGGLTDTDFVAQYLTLTASGEERPPRATRAALRWHAAAGRLSPDDERDLVSAHGLFEAVAQYGRATFGHDQPTELSAAQAQRLCRLARCDAPVTALVAEAAERVAAISRRLVG